jgi:hypothetical protein
MNVSEDKAPVRKKKAPKRPDDRPDFDPEKLARQDNIEDRSELMGRFPSNPD